MSETNTNENAGTSQSKFPRLTRWINELNFEAPCRACGNQSRTFQRHSGFLGKYWKCNNCGTKFPGDVPEFVPPPDPQKRIKPPAEAFVTMIGTTKEGVQLAAILLSEEWASLKALYSPEKGVNSWRDLVPKDSTGFPSMSEEEYLKRAHHVMLTLRKDEMDKIADARSRQTEANLEKQYASTHVRLKCGCLLARDLVFQRYAMNLAHYTRRGWPPLKGGYASCSNPKHDTALDKYGDVLPGAVDYRDYRIVEQVLKGK